MRSEKGWASASGRMPELAGNTRLFPLAPLKANYGRAETRQHARQCNFEPPAEEPEDAARQYGGEEETRLETNHEMRGLWLFAHRTSTGGERMHNAWGEVP